METAVEWLINQLERQGDASVNVSIGRMQISIKEEDFLGLIEQAKEMEKQQIVDAYYGEAKSTEILDAEEYYNKTFKK